jgi:hypothetical protein
MHLVPRCIFDSFGKVHRGVDFIVNPRERTAHKLDSWRFYTRIVCSGAYTANGFDGGAKMHMFILALMCTRTIGAQLQCLAANAGKPGSASAISAHDQSHFTG